MSDQLTSSTGTSMIGGTEARSSRSFLTLLMPIAIVGVALALVPLWLSDSRVLMGVAVLGLTCVLVPSLALVASVQPYSPTI
jgi:hypothetical protein